MFFKATATNSEYILLEHFRKDLCLLVIVYHRPIIFALNNLKDQLTKGTC